MVDTKDLKSFGAEAPCGFESRFLYRVAGFYEAGHIFFLQVSGRINSLTIGLILTLTYKKALPGNSGQSFLWSGS